MLLGQSHTCGDTRDGCCALLSTIEHVSLLVQYLRCMTPVIAIIFAKELRADRGEEATKTETTNLPRVDVSCALASLSPPKASRPTFRFVGMLYKAGGDDDEINGCHSSANSLD